ARSRSTSRPDSSRPRSRRSRSPATPSSASNDRGARRVKAYEQVAERLRERVVSGDLPPGARLPNESVLAQDFAVSRATVREALRSLAAQNMIRTAKGAGGGSFVTSPSVDGVSDFLHSSIALMAHAEDVTLEQLIEARELLEVPAARLAAERRHTELVERLEEAIPEKPL